MKKIAPTLQRYVDGFPDGAVYDAARAELRALLAVVRKATAVCELNPHGTDPHAGDQLVGSLRIALSRLAKVSHD
jgi:hypothetical protein